MSTASRRRGAMKLMGKLPALPPIVVPEFLQPPPPPPLPPIPLPPEPVDSGVPKCPECKREESRCKCGHIWCPLCGESIPSQTERGLEMHKKARHRRKK